MTPLLSSPPAVHHPVSTHHQPHKIGASVRSVDGSPIFHRGDEPAAPARTLDPRRKGCVGSELNGEVGGGGVGNDGCSGGVAAPVTFSVGTAEQQQQQQGKQQHVRAERPPRPLSIESAVSMEGGSDSSREASSYVWRVLVYLAFINPFLCLLNSLYATLVLLAGLITYPIRYFLLPKDHSYTTTPGLAYLLLVHLRFVYPRSTRSRHSILPLPEDFDPARLVIVHLFGPFLAMALAVTSSILVFIWIYTEVILGEKNESRSAEYRGVMFVKERWEEYLLIALKPKSLDSY
ncbi:hypothetical protein Q9L58_005261 [Maublancomyces gigas]|uniref:Uncharacterized protein n=1 Tax=Discina gigas TaxID=1032678 RepID=A0ABR3GIF7_9PEZI